MEKMIVVACLILTLSTLSHAATVVCPGAASGSCKCQSTDGIPCPAGYYCPGYSASQITANAGTIEAANCTVRGDGELQCPCTPGFYCPENTLTPSYCCSGHYCKTPAEIAECEEGYFCKTGYVEGIECGSDSDCPAGSDQSSRTGAFIGLVLIGMILRVVFWIKYYIEYKVKETENMVLSQQKVQNATDISPAAVERMTSVDGRPLLDHKKSSKSLNDDDGVKSPFGSMSVTSSDDAVPPPEPSAEPHKTDGVGYTIKFENIGLTLPSGTTIMRGVCGEFRPQRMCAIMGPSGAGKTTIINLITGKALKSEGSLEVNGEKVNDLAKWKKLVGFVPQEDVMIRQLTVRDNISFSAAYRLPVEMTAAQKEDVVNQTLLSLGIDHVQHSLIGDERERGISGGQRKRVNIGIELVALPKVLFLDEPTSGLDSTSSAVLARQLKDIATRQNVTIASVIHQPSIQAFLEFDDLLLLGKGGEVVYHGPVDEAPAYFESIGFTPTGLTNPADFYLDITNGAVAREGDPDFTPADLFRFWHNKLMGLPYDTPEGGDAPARSRAGTIHTKEYASRVSSELNPLQSSSAMCVFLSSICLFFYNIIVGSLLELQAIFVGFFKEITRTDDIRNTPGFFSQLYVCFTRAFKQKYRRFGGFLSQMLIHMGVALVVSSVSTDLQYVGPLPDVVCKTVTRDLNDACTSPLIDSYQGTANFLCFGTIFAAISVSTGTFGNEQVNYWRECTAGLKTVPYFLAKWLIEVPNIVLASMFFWFAFLIRFPNTNTSGALYELFFAMYWWSWALGFLLSSVASPKNVFLMGVLAALILAVGFSGANPTINEVRDMSSGIRWLWSLSGTRWALEGFYVSQVKYYEDVPSGPLEGEQYMDIDAGLDAIGYNIDNFDKSVVALIWNGLGYGLTAMVIMAFTNRDKKK